MANTHIDSIGLGRMGGAMAANLLAAGVPLFVFDAREEAVEPLLVRGATIVSNPAKLADKVELLFLCLPFAPEVDEVLFGKNGVATSGPIRPLNRGYDHDVLRRCVAFPG